MVGRVGTSSVGPMVPLYQPVGSVTNLHQRVCRIFWKALLSCIHRSLVRRISHLSFAVDWYAHQSFVALDYSADVVEAGLLERIDLATTAFPQQHRDLRRAVAAIVVRLLAALNDLNVITTVRSPSGSHRANSLLRDRDSA